MFIIDPNGILRQITINDLPIGRSVEEALRIIEALRFVEEHGEGKQIFVVFYILWSFGYLTDIICFLVCPANWKKGDKTIKPDPKGSQEYFKSTHE